MKLFYKAGACSLATHIVLEWIGEPFEAVGVTLHPASPELLEVSSVGAVPVLVTEDKVLTQNMAILPYLAEKYPTAELCGDGSLEQRTEINYWLGLINSDLHPMFGPIYGATGFLKDAEVIETTKIVARKRIAKKLAFINDALADKEWLASTRSAADAYLFTILGWLKFAQVDISDLTHLTAFQARMLEDAGVQNAMCREGLLD